MSTTEAVNYNEIEFGFSNDKEFELMSLVTGGLSHDTWTSSTARASDTTIISGNFNLSGMGFNTVWIGLRDDGTSVHFEFSQDSVNFTPAFSVVRSTGFLGATGYTHIFFGVVPDSASPQYLTVRCYDLNGLTRTFP